MDHGYSWHGVASHQASSLAQAFAVTTRSHPECFKCGETGRWRGEGSIQNTTQLPLTSSKIIWHHCKKDSHEDKEGGSTPTFELHREQPSVPLWRGKSPQVHWVANILEKSHPKFSIKIYNKNFKCLIDTGADKTILRRAKVPSRWTLLPGPQLKGVGGFSWALLTGDIYVEGPRWNT